VGRNGVVKNIEILKELNNVEKRRIDNLQTSRTDVVGVSFVCKERVEDGKGGENKEIFPLYID